MPIHNLRYGFANNSSSTHSTLLCSDNILNKIKDVDPDFYGGWAWVILKSKEWKEAYFFAQILPAIYRDLNLNEHNLTHPDTFPVISDLLKLITRNDVVYYVDQTESYETTSQEKIIYINDKIINHIDHESQWYIPLNKHTQQIDILFCQKLYNFIMEDRVVIRGGNDNTDLNDITEFGEHFEMFEILEGVKKIQDKFNPFYSKECIAIHDGEMTTIFNPKNGNKIRFSFNEIECDDPILKKAQHPELVDLNITDYCEMNCSFCYRGCTRNGKHASLDLIKNYVDYLKTTNTLEIAIGGGDVTKHPQLIDIIQIIRDANIVPNLTIHERSFLNILETRNEKLLDNIVDLCGSIAISPTTPYMNDVLFCSDYFQKKYNDKIKISFQIIPELFDKNVFDHLLSDAFKLRYDSSVTLLGYKESKRSGWRGIPKNQQYFLQSGKHSEMLLEFIKKLNSEFFVQVNCDTLFVSRFEAIIQELKVSKKLYYIEEGKYSCYIDSVANTISKSSYADESFQLQTPEDILTHYKTF